MSREQELALCDREIAEAEAKVLAVGEPYDFVWLTDWLWEREALRMEGAFDESLLSFR